MKTSFNRESSPRVVLLQKQAESIEDEGMRHDKCSVWLSPLAAPKVSHYKVMGGRLYLSISYFPIGSSNFRSCYVHQPVRGPSRQDTPLFIPNITQRA